MMYFFWRYFITVMLLISTLNHGICKESSVKIATINHDRVILSSKLFQKAHEEHDKQSEIYEKDFKQQQDILRQLEKELRESELKLSSEEFSKKRLIFEKKLEETQKIVAERRHKLDEYLHTTRLKVVEKAMEIIKQLCEERSIIVVVPISQIIYAVPSLDITEEVLNRLNQSLQKDLT